MKIKNIPTLTQEDLVPGTIVKCTRPLAFVMDVPDFRSRSFFAEEETATILCYVTNKKLLFDKLIQIIPKKRLEAWGISKPKHIDYNLLCYNNVKHYFFILSSKTNKFINISKTLTSQNLDNVN